MIKQNGGVFGRNPSFNNVEVESLTIAGDAVPDASTILVDSDVGTIASQDADSVNIDGGAIDGVTLGTNSAITEAQIDNVNINGSVVGLTTNNNGRLADALNYILFTDTDTSSVTGQPLGEIQFYNSDSNGPGVNAIIRGVSQFTSGISGIEMFTGGSGSPGKTMTLNWDGGIFMPFVYNDTVGATNRDLFIDDTGRIGYVSSTLESKDNIADLDNVSWLLNLNPVSFHRRVVIPASVDDQGNIIPESYSDDVYDETEYGLIAEQVETVNSDLCFYNKTDDGQELAGVHYQKLISPLLKLIQQQQQTISNLESRISALEN